MAREPLSDKERRLMERLLSFPLLFPSEFTGWLPQHIGLVGNIPESAVVRAVDAWHAVDDTDEPAFQNSWVNYSSVTHEVAAFRKQDGLVYLSGRIKSGTIGTAAFTLPTGYAPSAAVDLAAASNGAFGHLVVESDGDVIPTVGNNAWFSLNGLFFRAE